MEEERYVLTPKGCATAAMLGVKLVDSIDDPRIEPFWILFEHYMRKGGYIHENVEHDEDLSDGALD